MHQGDRDGVKGIYLINAVDEVTQWQHVGAVPAIPERFLMPILEAMIEVYPFVIHGFHSDNGPEFVNRIVLQLLDRLPIEFTKSRPRHSNDNARVEGRNGSVVCKILGHDHIPRHLAEPVNRFTRDILSPWLNHHRPCLFPEERRDGKGRIRRHYPYCNLATPYEKRKSLPQAESFLKPGVTFAKLDVIAHAQDDIEAATLMHQARNQLFRTIYNRQKA